MTISTLTPRPLRSPRPTGPNRAVDVDPLAEAETESGAVPANIGPGIREADDADLVEQETVVYGEDDDSR